MEGIQKNNNEIKNQNKVESLDSTISEHPEVINKEIKIETPEEKENLVNLKRNEILEMFDDKKENNFENKEIIKYGVDFVFEQNPELKKIGTKEQYSEYLDSIFPESKVRGMVYHGSDKKDIEQFKPGKLDIGVHFGTLGAAQYRGEKSESYKIYPALINILKIKEVPDLYVFNQHNVFNYLLNEGLVKEGERIDLDNLYKKNPINNYRDNGGDAMFEYLQNKINADGLRYINNFEDKGSISYIVFNPNNIYTLGSNEDVSNFKKFVENYQDSQG